MNRIVEIVRNNKAKSDKKKKARSDRIENRRNFRLEKIAALTQKFYAVAAKRKWLVFMMVLGIVIYFIITSGGGFSFIGIFEKIKGVFF